MIASGCAGRQWVGRVGRIFLPFAQCAGAPRCHPVCARRRGMPGARPARDRAGLGRSPGCPSAACRPPPVQAPPRPAAHPL